MTQINFDFGKPSAGGVADLANATVSVIPTERFRNGSRIVVREDFGVTLDAKGKATVTVPPTDSTFCYEVTVGLDTDRWKFRRYVNVPDSTTAVAFADLPDVDKATFGPIGNNGRMLVFEMAGSLDEAKTLSAQYPTHMVFYPESSAQTVASQILEDLTGARAVVESQSAQAAQAANVAQAAASQVAAQAQSVQTAADAISESKATVESHADAALTAIDEAVKQVQDKASDAAVDTEPSSGTTDEAPADTDSTSGVSQED